MNKLVFFLLVFLCALSLFSTQRVFAQETKIEGPTVWTKETVPSFIDGPVYVINNQTLTIEKGVVVKFEKNADDEDGENPSGIFVENGNLIVNGTQEEPVRFTSDEEESGFVIKIYNSPVKSFLRWAEITKAGCTRSGGGELPPTSMFIKNIFSSTAYADELEIRSHQTCTALEIEGGNVHIENSTFRNNHSLDLYVGDEVYNDPDDSRTYRANVEIINSNFYDEDAYISEIDCWVDNQETGEYYWDRNCRERVYLKNNWLEKGENTCEYSETCYVELEREKELIADPVIVIPGIMGTAETLSGWQLDPILHSYDNLVGGLEDNGYTLNQNLFAFVYDWRKDNQLSAQYLQAKVEAVIAETKVSKVDLVAHSMGGLIARAYIEEAVDQTKYPLEYNNTVHKLVTLGTPQRGAPKAYLRWEAGEGFFGILDGVAKHHFIEEAEHAGYAELYKYIREKVPSAGQLLPDYDYLKDSDGEMRSYSEKYPQNTFLEKLNESGNIAKLAGVDFTKIIGYSNLDNTISAIKVGKISFSSNSIWAHGKPENFDDPKTNRGLEYDKGDETVPKFSASEIEADKTIPVEFSHQDLPSEAQCDVFHELTGENTVCTKNTDWHVTNILLINIFSPIDVQVVAPDGVHWAGKKIRPLEDINQIEGAYYTGYAGVDNEFITIPNPAQTGEYQIITEGTGTGGAYRVEVAKISEGSDGVAEESTVKIFGTAVEGETEEKSVEIKDGKLIDENADLEVPTIEIQNPKEGQKYPNDRVLNIEYSLSDNQSQPDKITAEIFWDDVLLAKNEIDLRLQKPGTHSLKIVAKDEAGNARTAERWVEVVTDAGVMLKNIDYYFAQKLIKTQAEKKFLAVHFLSLKISQELLSGIENCAYALNSKLRLALTSGLERQISLEIALLEKHVKAASVKIITPEGKELFLANLAYLKK